MTETNAEPELDVDLAAEQAAILRDEQDRAVRLKQRLENIHRTIFRLLWVAACFPAGLAIYLLRDSFLEQQVASSQPIGTLQGMSVAGGSRGGVVLQTESGYYPLKTPIAAARGVSLTVEVRRNGSRYVCSPGRAICVETARRSLE